MLDAVPTTNGVFHPSYASAGQYLALLHRQLFRAEKTGDPVLETAGVEPAPKQTRLSSKFDTVFCPMADRLASATGNYSFRFFSPEQIDRILREGVKRGRTGSHSAIERILKHEPGLGRTELWRRIHQLKQPSNGKLYQRTTWSPEDDQILRKGYEEGWNGKREAVRELLWRHLGW